MTYCLFINRRLIFPLSFLKKREFSCDPMLLEDVIPAFAGMTSRGEKANQNTTIIEVVEALMHLKIVIARSEATKQSHGG